MSIHKFKGLRTLSDITTENWIAHFERQSNMFIERSNERNEQSVYYLENAVHYLACALRERRLNILKIHCE